jgi:hypothetical protein
MRNLLWFKLYYTKIALLFTKSFKRQKYIDNLNKFIEDFMSEFDEDDINTIKEQIKYIRKQHCEELFSKEFYIYDFIKFGKARLEIDKYKPKECQTFAQFNQSLQMALMAIDYDKNLEE